MAIPLTSSRLRQPRSITEGQRGAVLIVGLVILLVVTMVGIGSQQGTILQERMAGNMRQNNIAFQTAEAAQQLALAYIEAEQKPIIPDASGSDFVWTSCSVADAVAKVSGCQRLKDTVLVDWKTSPAAKMTAGKTYDALAAALGQAVAKQDTGYSFPGVVGDPRIYIECREERYSPDAQDNSFGESVVYFYTVTSIGFGATEQARAILQSTIARIYP